MKKVLSFILTVILILNIGMVAFAVQGEDVEVPLTKSEAEELAIDFVAHDGCFHNTTLTVYNDNRFYVNIPAYEVVSTVRLKSGDVVKYITFVDQYSGKIYYRTAQFERNIAPLTKREALEYAYKVLCITAEDTTILTNRETTNSFSETVYQFSFCKDNFVRYDCTINAANGFIDKVSVGKPSSIIERIIILFKMLLARINLTGRFDGITSIF